MTKIKLTTLLLTTIVFALVFSGCAKTPAVGNNVSQNQNVNVNINSNIAIQNQNINNNKVANPSIVIDHNWQITANGNEQKISNSYLNISFEYPSQGGDVKFDHTAYPYLALIKKTPDNAANDYYNDYLFTLTADYLIDNNSKYQESNFEDYIKQNYKYIALPWVGGTGAETPSKEQIDQLFKILKPAYKKIIGKDNLPIYEIYTTGTDLLGKKSDYRNLIIYYPGSFNKDKSSKIFYINIGIDNVKNPDIYQSIISSFGFMK
ncbi:MAG: hypothetical protein WCX71_05935 [Candidatus Buchananbacteria bacterium]